MTLVKLAQSGRAIMALDGCALACVSARLGNVGVKPDRHLVLNRQGAKKRFHADASVEELEQIWQVVRHELRDMALKKSVEKLIETNVDELTESIK